MKDSDLEGLYAYAIRVLAARAYSEATLKRKLLERGSSEHTGTVLSRLKQAGYLDDLNYAQGYARLYANRWGAGKIRRSLREKGVAVATIDQALSELDLPAQAVDEAQKLLERYRTRHKGDKSKAVRFLLGRGYTLGEALGAWTAFEQGAE